MARAATAAARPKPARATSARARHSTRRRAAASSRAPARRRASGPAAATAVALPVRVLNARFARAARRGTSGMLDALISGRGWIALVFVLLAGIVFFNVDLLQMNREIAGNAEKIGALKREIARNRLDVARLASSERIQESAAKLGLVLPAPGDVRYLKARPRLDPRQAAKRVSAPNTAYAPPEPIDTAPEPVSPTVTDPAATTDPAAAPTTTDPATTDPAAADPTAAPAPTTTPTPAG
jgi:cell division protein FtsL